MNVTLWRLTSLFASIIFFSNPGLAVCPGSLHQTGLAGYALSPDATRIAAVAEDGALFWWDVASGKRTQLAECVKPQVLDHPILFSPDATRLAVALESGVQVFDISTGNVLARITSPKLKEIYEISFSGDGRLLAASSNAGAVVWDINSPAEVSSFPAQSVRKALALNRDGTLLALSCREGVEIWTLPAKAVPRRLAVGVQVESVLFAHQDQWIVALTASPLPRQPKQRVQKYKRGIAAWDFATGKKLRTFKAGPDLDEQRFGLVSGGPHLLLATDFTGHLRAWDLDSGELKAVWETSSGHPSADGRFLLRDGGAPGQLELWPIGSRDEEARPFAYKSPMCAESFADNQGNLKFDDLFIADGFSDDDEPFGSYAGHGYVAQDCTPMNVTHLSYKTEERARQELDREVAQAVEVLEKDPPKDAWWQGLSGERTVLRFPRRGPALGSFAVIWLRGNSLIEINSPSLPVALAAEKQMLEKR